MSNQIRLKRGSGSNPSASDLVVGEVALRTDNGKLFTKKDDNSITEIGSGISDGDKGDITISNSGATFTIDSGVVSTGKIANSAITNAKLNDSAITTAKIANNAVTTAKILDGNVTSAKILDGTITNADINASAAIAGSKISPTFTSSISTSGELNFTGNGNKFIDFATLNGSNSISLRHQDGSSFETAATFTANGGASITFDGSTKLVTTNTGIDVTGEISTTGHIRVPDNMALIAGTGSDLFIYHDGSNSYIQDVGTGKLKVITNNLEVLNAANNEYLIYAIENGSVELYEDGVKKAETTADGFNVEGTLHANGLDMDDNHKIKLGLGDDLEIYHNGTNSYIENNTGGVRFNTDAGDIQINKGTSEYMARFITDGAVELYYDNSKKFETTSAGATVTGSLGIGATPLRKLHIADTGDVALMLQTTNANNDAEIFEIGCGANSSSNADLVFRTRLNSGSGGSEVFRLTNDGNVQISNDTGKLQLGASQDLQIYHEGSHSRIVDSGTGFLVVQSSRFQINNAANTENMAAFIENGAVELYHDNSKKFETTSGGSKVTGNFIVNSGHISIDVDNKKLLLGASDDLQIYHDGSESYVKNANASSNLILESAHGVHIKHGGENMARFIQDGAVELMFDNSKKFETTANGVKVPDAVRIAVGDSEDAFFYHNGAGSDGAISNTVGNFLIYGGGGQIYLRPVNTENALIAKPNEGVELYYDASKKFETTSNGVAVTSSGDTIIKVTSADGNAAFLDLGDASDPDGGRIHYDSGSNLVFNTASSERMRIDSSGNLFLNGTAYNGGGSTPGLYVRNTSGRQVKIHNRLTGTCSLQITNATTGEGEDAGFQIATLSTGDGFINMPHSNAIRFSTSNTERMRIDSSGRLMIGLNSTGTTSEGMIFSPGETSTFYKDSGTLLIMGGGVSQTIIQFRQGGTNIGSITKSTTNVGFNTSGSDRSLKKNFESWNENVLNLFKNINPQKFNFIEEEDTEVKTKGYIAQDLVDSFPEAYPKGDDDKYMFNPSGMVVYLMKAIQELEAEVASLKAS